MEQGQLPLNVTNDQPVSPAKPDKTRYIEKLASVEEYSPGDSWISLTDAARITRTTEVMVRRWVKAGRLPIKKEPVGANLHTRLARISDVAAIRPIIDPTAAISGEISMLDLPSIPRQQAQIMEDHKQLLATSTQSIQQIEQLTKQHAEDQHQIRQALSLMERKQIANHTEMLKQINMLLAVHNQQTEELQALKKDTQSSIEAATQKMTEYTDSRIKLLQNAISGIDSQYKTAIEKERNQTKEELQKLASQFTQKHEELRSNLLQINHTLTANHNALRENVQVHMKNTTASLLQITTDIISMKQSNENSQQHAMIQEKRIESLQQQLDEERKERLSMRHQITSLTESVQALQSQKRK